MLVNRWSYVPITHFLMQGKDTSYIRPEDLFHLQVFHRMLIDSTLSNLYSTTCLILPSIPDLPGQLLSTAHHTVE